MRTVEERETETQMRRGTSELRKGLDYVRLGLTELGMAQVHLKKAGVLEASYAAESAMRLLSKVVDELISYDGRWR